MLSLASRTTHHAFTPTTRRFLSASATWEQDWATAVSKISVDVSHAESAELLRGVVRTGLLSYTDLQDNPERFFAAHRILAKRTPDIGPGFWIRLTVSYNLCAGTVLGLGNEEQVESLRTWGSEGKIGCFGLTEIGAGVSSGLVVNTKAEWDASENCFRLTTPDRGAEKNWISQGFTADKAVVIASLTVDGKPCGPHGFLVDLRHPETGAVTDGVTLTDMGLKTVGNDLDNTQIAFDDVRLPHSALLSRFSGVEDNKYVQYAQGIHPMTILGQRLFSGRVAVAQAAIEFRQEIFRRTKDYADAKLCWGPKSSPPLSSIPQLAALLEEEEEGAARLRAFTVACEEQLCAKLRARELPDDSLIQAIAVGKITAVDESIDLVSRLSREVGSRALMVGSGFEQSDFLLCCRFAEGDSNILKQKLARDRMRDFTRGKAPSSGDEETERCAELVAALADSGLSAEEAWNQEWRKVYGLADAVAARVTREFV